MDYFRESKLVYQTIIIHNINILCYLHVNHKGFVFILDLCNNSFFIYNITMIQLGSKMQILPSYNPATIIPYGYN